MAGESGSQKVTRTGLFKGSWTETCPHCGREQSTHRSTTDCLDGEMLEHRLPCEQEKRKIDREAWRKVRAAQFIVLIIWVLIPTAILLIQEIPFFARLAFFCSLVALGWKVVKIFGRPEKWFPPYGKRMEEKEREEIRKAHILHHCEKNPDLFQQLLIKSIEREQQRKSESTE